MNCFILFIFSSHFLVIFFPRSIFVCFLFRFDHCSFYYCVKVMFDYILYNQGCELPVGLLISASMGVVFSV